MVEAKLIGTLKDLREVYRADNAQLPDQIQAFKKVGIFYPYTISPSDFALFMSLPEQENFIPLGLR